MEHYFTNELNKKENRRDIHFRFLGEEETFVSDDGVFSKDTLDFGSRLMLETLMKEKIEGNVLDLGCGIGPIGILLKKYHSNIQLTMTDVNDRAVSLARSNSQRYQQDNVVISSNGFENISSFFDIIVSNPPIRTGKKVIYDLFLDSYHHLKPDGKLYLVIRQKQGAESAIKYLSTFFASVNTIEKKNGYWIIFCQKDN